MSESLLSSLGNLQCLLLVKISHDKPLKSQISEPELKDLAKPFKSYIF